MARLVRPTYLFLRSLCVSLCFLFGLNIYTVFQHQLKRIALQYDACKIQTEESETIRSDSGGFLAKSKLQQTEIKSDLNIKLSTVAPDLISTTHVEELCPETPPGLVGRINVSEQYFELDNLEREMDWVNEGGQWWPARCRARYKVAIVVPYRDRTRELSIFLHHMHPFLRDQELHYRIFLAEQTEKSNFNRAMLMNVGFVEASKIEKFDCFVFHDVDVLPEDDRIIYSCPDQPRHLSAACSRFNYTLKYKTLVGGVIAFRTEQFRKINGFSNAYFGWGGEDDDLYKRIKANHFYVTRYPLEIARYKTLDHDQQNLGKDRMFYLKKASRRYKKDGLNSMIYKRINITEEPLLTRILVELDQDVIRNKVDKIMGNRFPVRYPGKRFRTRRPLKRPHKLPFGKISNS